MDQATTTAIFAKAAEATSWKRTNLGLTAKVAHDGFDWTVRLPAEGEGRAYISGSSGWGGGTAEYQEATWAETARIVDAAMAATRLH
ncbi:hypothetical protein GCM10010250_21810 [Streptomyces althioticus]|uniref:hypothetical protein n=1 Tax=Streptomyces althioticus TaxID=83380 RepID=UPI0018746171|nr:hypothetical protein GCM10010250_21810 [Streptomyces althioticus]